MRICAGMDFPLRNEDTCRQLHVLADFVVRDISAMLINILS